MNVNHMLALAVLAGIVIGVGGVKTIHAQQTKAAPAYIIAEVDVTDPAIFQKYSDQVPGTLTAYNGHYLIRGGKTEAIEGEAPKGRFVVLAFDSVEKARAWENSPAYEKIKPIRHSSAKTRMFIAEGIAP